MAWERVGTVLLCRFDVRFALVSRRHRGEEEIPRLPTDKALAMFAAPEPEEEEDRRAVG